MASVSDPWEHLKSLTAARIALGRAGASLPTRELLDFALAHARARDAVHAAFDPAELAARLRPLGAETLVLETEASSRQEYLQRPDLGRRLTAASRERLARQAASSPRPELAVIVSDGLSALAAVRQVPPLLQELLPRLQQEGWRLAPVTIVPQARVALEDEIGHLLGAQLALILLGERPGLGSPDSLGAYLIYGPAPGLTDARRNCVSNIRPEGLPPAVAAQTLHYLLSEARRRKLSGVGLKDERGAISGDAPRALDAASPE